MGSKVNPWAICHAQLGKEKTDKFERCVKQVKAKQGIKDWTEFAYKVVSLHEKLQQRNNTSLSEKLAYLAEKKKDKNWIQGAVDPEHEGYCTPMTKETCTPKRKALAKTFKKMGKKRDKEIVSKKEKKAKGK